MLIVVVTRGCLPGAGPEVSRASTRRTGSSWNGGDDLDLDLPLGLGQRGNLGDCVGGTGLRKVLVAQVLRTVYPQMPLKVEYSLTAAGRSLEPLLVALRAWGEEHRDQTSGKPTPLPY